MAVKPVLMVLYTNDAVEVRYSDKSRLHILPCGTSFSYHTLTESHPVHGMSTVQQRSCFVTSQYRENLISALDFRNRFAERPFLCSDLISKEDIVSLYAKITQIAWPKSPSTQHCEVLEDGSVRITSVDEFASLILSPHRKDFTICYLSLISQEKRRERVKLRKERQAGRVNGKVKDNGFNIRKSDRHNDKLNEKQYGEHIPEVLISATTPVRKSNNSSKCEDNYIDGEDLNISPITQASGAGSPSGVSHASGSPITPQDAVKDQEAKFRPFSTPTEELENLGFLEQCLDKKGRRSKHLAVNREGSFLGEDYNNHLNKKKDISDSHLSQPKTVESQGFSHSSEQCLSISRPCEESGEVPCVEESTIRNSSNDSGSSDRSSASEGSESDARCCYCWVTRHMSRDECPLTWSHVVKMGEEIADRKGDFLMTDGGPKQHDEKTVDVPGKLRKIKKDECVLSEVPSSLPLTCQGQHLHKTHSSKKVFDDGKDPIEDWTSLSQGRLKVILVDGVVYRIVRLPTINMVEVYPGDGSVLVSQGMSAHFFQHIIPGKDKVEERTYSVKSPPQSVAGSHSVKSLMNRAHRLLAHVRQEVNMPSLNTGLCCWKHEEIQIEEPMCTVLLEDCSIPGYGKFTAMSNGQIRIVFNDRTALDMTCDFSKRLKRCMDHSSIEGSVVVPSKKDGICRLLLPNGHYQMVDINHPGQYKKYIQMAKEWSDWVNSSPGERKTFYKERLDSNMNVCVDRELQKIKCFNYVVDNTVLNKNTGDLSNSTGFSKQTTVRPGILRHVDSNSNSSHDHVKSYAPTRNVQIHSPPSRNSVYNKSNHSTMSSVHLENGSVIDSSSSAYIPPTSLRLNPIGQCQPISAPVERYHVPSHTIGQSKPITSFLPQDSSRMTNFEGFNAVRQALLKTSNVIKDLDSLLDKKNNLILLVLKGTIPGFCETKSRKGDQI